MCGPEEALCREVVRHYRDQLPGASKTALWARGNEAWLWDVLLSGAPFRSRLTVVHDAELLVRADAMIPVLLGAIPDGHFAVFVSAGDDFPRVPSGDQPLVPALDALKRHRDGQLVRCCRPSKEEELLKLVASWWPGAGPNHAWKVWQRCGESLAAAWQACEIARRAGLPADEQHLDYLTPMLEPARWSGLVMAGSRAAAMEAGAGLDQPGQLRAVGELNAALARAVGYARLSVQGRTPDEIARRGISRFQQHQLAPYASRYGPEREIRCRKLLALAEDALRSGARQGVLEAVAASW